jgi:hypothetical protein
MNEPAVPLTPSEQEGVRARGVMIICDFTGLVFCLAALVILAWDGKLDAACATALGGFAMQFGLGLRDAHTFEFGSSRGSRSKDEALAAIARQP